MKKNAWKKMIAILLTACLAAAQLPLALGAESKGGGIFIGEGGELGDGKASVKVTLKYQYSPTGGMAGINAHAPETVEFFLNQDGETTTPAVWPIPYYNADGNNEHHDHDHTNLRGFRVVLNAAPLNKFVKDPPTGKETEKELEEKLNRGDFDPDPKKMEDTAAVMQAWIAGRTFTDPESGLTFQVVDKDGNAAVGSEALVEPQLKLVNPGKLRELDKKNVELTLEVNYRRDNGTYWVRHWIPKKEVLAPDTLKPEDWSLSTEEKKQGRIGAMTRGEAQFIQGYVNRAISQQPIQADGSTVVDIFYVQDNTVRVIFDTSEAVSGEITRQALNITDEDQSTVDFSAISPGGAKAPVRPGYVFAGWAFRDKASGDLVSIETLAGLYDTESKVLTPDEAFLNRAQLQVSQETAGVNVLQFYPIWEKGTTSVRVVFWTEDLTGYDDAERRDKDAPGELKVKTHYFDETDAAYSNVGFQTLEGVQTNTKLEVNLATGELEYTDGSGSPATLPLTDELAKLTTMKIQTVYQGEGALEDSSKFYTLNGSRITQMDDTHRATRDTETAAPNGTTVVNVYYIRNIYKLEFVYSTMKNRKPVVAVHTRGYANGNESETAAANTQMELASEEELAEKIPPRQVITAKYGADLRNIWPYHGGLTVHIRQTGESEEKGNEAQFVSWTTTAGPYNAEARRLGLFDDMSNSEPTIMGVYGAMSADIIPDPEQHLKQDGVYNEQTGTHRLYAYWSDWLEDSYYRYNHCYEVPGVTREMLEEQDGIVELAIDGQDGSDLRNVCYLLPAEGSGEVLDAIRHDGFADLKKVQYTDGMSINEIQIKDDGNYYGFRVYQAQGGEEKCYALARQVNVVSTNSIQAQTPSARLHMRRANSKPEHSTAWQDNSGGIPRDPIGSVDAPCELFFYYDRVSYTIFYSVGGKDGVKDLGTKTIFYGAKLSDAYNIQLDSGVSADGTTANVKTNGAYARPNYPDGWELPAGDVNGTQEVCPSRNSAGTKPWTFKGWAMDLAGTALMNSSDDWNGIVSGDLQLYAQWEAPKYTVEFDWDGGHLAFGSEEDYQKQEISANSSIAGGGLAPVPVKSGYYLDHWRVTHYKLSEESGWEPVKAEDDRFLFDNRISRSLKVQAVWKPIRGAKELEYLVQHVLGSDPGVKIAPDQEVSGSFVPGSTVWGSPIKLGSYQGKDYSDYVPTVQNAGTSVPLDGSDPAPITITYRPPTAEDAFTYTVNFTDWETGKEVDTIRIPAAESSRTVYAGSYQEALDQKGYWLADKDGQRADLQDDALQKTLSHGKEMTAVFPVIAQVYGLTYDWPSGMDEETAAALEKDLPKTYSPAKGTLSLPELRSYQQGEKTRYFAGWKLTKGILQGEPSSAGKVFDKVVIEPESRGDLTFVAQWSDTPVTPSRPSRPSNSGGDSVRLEREKHEAYIVGRDGGLVAPEAEITRAEVVTIFYRLLTEESRKAFATAENPFPDVSSEDWFFTAVTTLTKAKIVEGLPDGSFAPSANITRGEFAAIAARFLSKTYTGESHFSDIEGHWAAEYVDRAAQAGWIKGYPDGTFRPDNNITRAEAISLVNAVLGRSPHKEHLLDGMTIWPDNLDTAVWYYLDIQEATNSHEYTWQTLNGERVERWTALFGGKTA